MIFWMNEVSKIRCRCLSNRKFFCSRIADVAIVKPLTFGFPQKRQAPEAGVTNFCLLVSARTQQLAPFTVRFVALCR